MRNDFLGLAATDMEEAKASSMLLLKLNSGFNIDYPKDYTHQLKKALETAVCTSYSRAFTQSKHSAGKLLEGDIEHLTENEKVLHKQLLDLRNNRYAHTDEQEKTGRRTETLSGGYAEYWIPLTDEFLENTINLCEKNRDVWRSKIK